MSREASASNASSENEFGTCLDPDLADPVYQLTPNLCWSRARRWPSGDELARFLRYAGEETTVQYTTIRVVQRRTDRCTCIGIKWDKGCSVWYLERRIRKVVKPNTHWNLTYGGEGGFEPPVGVLAPTTV